MLDESISDWSEAVIRGHDALPLGLGIEAAQNTSLTSYLLPWLSPARPSLRLGWPYPRGYLVKEIADRLNETKCDPAALARIRSRLGIRTDSAIRECERRIARYLV